MSKEVVLSVENISKQYRLGQVGTGTISHDLNRWWANLRGKEDPMSKVGQVNDRSKKAEGDYVWALKDINFEVKKGEVLGIIGKNGAGKSTLLKLISRITSPTSGSIKAKGRIASLLEVGTGMHPEMTARENIYLNGAIMGMKKHEIDRKFDEIVDFAGVAMYIDTPVKRFSSGMYVRLAFAVAAYLEPEILIVDEVLAVGDAEFQKKAIGKMKDVASGEGRTVLFVSHNMAAVQNLCTRAVLVDKGEIKYVGGVKETVENYLNHRQNQNKISLSERSDRIGQGQLQAIETWIENIKGVRVNSIQTGEDLTIAVRIRQMKEPFVSGNLIVSFALNTLTNIQISDISNYYTGDVISIQENDEDKVVKATIKKFPLNEGTYSYNVMLRFAENEQDWIKEANLFRVIKGDFYGNGRSYKDNRLLMVESSWK